MGTSSKKTERTIYGNTSTTNPYVVSKTNNKGTVSNFITGSALDTINQMVNANIAQILGDYLNPSLNSQKNQTLINNYKSTLSNNAKSIMENDIINPLSNRNMIRSSQATNMYNNLSNNLSGEMSNYMQELLHESQSNALEQFNTLLNAYMKGFDVIKANQEQSLKTSQGNAKKTTKESANGLAWSDVLKSITDLGASYLEGMNKKNEKTTKPGSATV